MAASEILDKDTISFQAEGRLLQELGLRLVAKPEVALVELVKNAYDADSPTCIVRLEKEGEELLVVDEGHGITLSDFKTKWMRIATPSKLGQELTTKYRRPLTGSKGIGRFAVRYLGDHLVLESVAYDSQFKCLTQLVATFDWPKLDSVHEIAQAIVEYTLVRKPPGTQTGTTLRIAKLRDATDFTHSAELRDEVLRIVSPLPSLERGKFARKESKDNVDPGFTVTLPGEGKAQDVDLAGMVLGNYWGRLTVELDGKELKYRVWLPGIKQPRSLNLKMSTGISEGLFADIRYFPRRKGVFKQKGLNGRKAWQWVRSSCGVKVVDHGFHIRPYGFPNDDWLRIDRDKAHSERDWKTSIAQKHFPVTPAEKGEPKFNPVLYLPYNFQVVGAVFIETRRNLGGKDETDLLPAMDREGLLENKAFEQLREIVRAGLEFLAHEDKGELDRRAEEEAKLAAREARDDIRSAIKSIAKSPTLTPGDKTRLIKNYQKLADRVQEQEEYSAQARHSLLTMSLLGVVAGFMTHESKAVIHDLEQAVEEVRRLAKKHPSLAKTEKSLSERLTRFQGYLDYARMYVRNVQSPKEQPLSAAGQVRHVLNRFKDFAEQRGIKVLNEVPDGVTTPPLPVTAYSGVLLNLYTNALKAVTSAQASIRSPKILFRAWNEKGNHVLEVADNGVGIPPELKDRIWDPLYTTTSDVANPLGSGMGLGLTLVKQVLGEFRGSISLVEHAPPGFSTCFRVVFGKR
jgi:signal transduction histidine kinase